MEFKQLHELRVALSWTFSMHITGCVIGEISEPG